MRSDIVKLAEKFINIPTLSSDNTELAKGLKLVKVIMDGSGLATKSFTYNGHKSLLFHKPGTERSEIILHAHLDVVTAAKKQFKAVVKADRLYGRGSLDMKGAMAVLMLLVKKYGTKKNIGLLVTTDEEIGGRNGCGYLAEEEKINCNYFLTGEPTDLHLSEEEKGVIWATLSLQGKATHTSTPWIGNNSILKLSGMLEKLQKKYPIPKSEKWVTTISPTQLVTGNSQNQIPEELTVRLDCRYIPEDDPLKIVDFLKALADNLQVQLIEPPLHAIPNKYSDILRKLTGKKAARMHFATDARFFNAKGIPSAIFGPAGGNMHGRDEWVSVPSLEKYYLILEKFIQNI